MNLSEMQNIQLDNRADFHFTVCTPLKSIKVLLPGLSEISLNFKVQVIRTYE